METVPQEKTIDGVAYKVSMLQAPEGRKLLLELKTILGPALAELMRGAKGEGESILDMDMGHVSGAIQALSEDISPEKYEQICKLMASKTQFSMDGWTSRLHLNDDVNHFQGRYLAEMKWLAFALEVNYSDFLSGLGSMKNIVGSLKAASGSTSQNSSTGTSGGSSPVNATA